MSMTNSKISALIASSEIAPYAKTGGLGDVMGSLPGPLAKQGVNVSLVMPAYRCVLEGGSNFENAGIPIKAPVSDHTETGEVLKSRNGDGVPVYLIKADKYFDREYLYGTPDGDYPDNAERFVFFSRAILEVARQLRPQVIHANDWQTALSIAFLKNQPALYPELAGTKSVMTIHNLGYQGRFRSDDWHLLNLDRSLFTPDYLEFYNDINFLKAGIVFADAITTVSPTYAQEIRTPEQGFGLEGVFQQRSDRLSGILNGVDYRIWNPETDLLIAREFNDRDVSGKTECKVNLQRHFGLEEDKDVPLIGMVTRLSAQKGLDLVQKAFDKLMAKDCQLVILGDGDRAIQGNLCQLSNRYPSQAAVEIGFNDSLSHQIIAGADFLLMPSRYEPCGLTQLYSLKYGTIPIVRATGGLKDTVMPFRSEHCRGNGFVFSPYESGRLLWAIDRALKVFANKEQWERLVTNAMAYDFSWTRSAKGYVDIYRRILDERPWS